MINQNEIESIFEQFLKTNQDARIIEIDKDFTIFYVSTLTDDLYIIDKINQIYFKKDFNFDRYFSSISSKVEPDQILNYLHNGNAIAVYNGNTFVISDAKSVEGRSVSTPVRESSLEGGLIGFTEQISININMVRHLYSGHSLGSELIYIGINKNINTAILYDKENVDDNLLNDVREKMNNINLPSVHASSELSQQLLKGQWFVPRLVSTERPDRVVKNLLKGRVIIFIEGAPEALIAPSTFHDFMSTVDDNYMLPIPAFFLIALRYAALFISIVFPASYVAFTAYNPEVYRIQLALSIAGSRSNVPYPAFIEVIFMLLMMEFLIEATVRLPKTIGQAAATVGGLILGQAATQASLVSNIMIIIVAAVAISNFVIPITSMGLSIRVAKYFMLAFTIFFGTYGMVIGSFMLIDYIFKLDSFSEPFFNPIGVDFNKIFSRLKRRNLKL